ncbi:peptidylprolyl isomerase [Geodermatophilus ruber]|uniref:Peptidyl-prolyl cis-trans isomerase B (Cyclophilin B) n=1 Tax=Geodermatophilus ruber TaxID=504800 RepID=A0A1I3YGD3_9ACTN|nr:peptidylprolyl isomerase [Geodermatophilus ruber]SFK30855.1 peptidyl-prolyl cis-trans isomerase B (cyclophilin B) [Geodermatophilus ruber]
MITVLFGLFGLIPAALAASRARKTGHSENRYWIAFGVSLIGSVALYIVAVLGVLSLFVTTVGSSDTPSAFTPDSVPAPSTDYIPAPTATNADGTVACNFIPDTSGNVNIIDVGTPPDAARTPTTGTSTLLMSTGQGDLTLTLDRATAPCAVSSFTFLAQQGFFDGSPCHREVNQETFGVLQCGDPSGTGQGGPSYKYGQEVTASTAYPRGTIAMANSGQVNSTGSQFFLCFTDTQLPPDYTAVGTVDEAGLAVLDTIAAAGNDGSFEPSPGGGAPNIPVVITAMTTQD